MTLHQDHPEPTNEPTDTNPAEPTQTPPPETPLAETPTATDPPAEAPPAETPPVKRRRRRLTYGRWTNPATPLQAARFERRVTGKEVVAGIRKLCPGHGKEPCKIDLSKISDYENAARRPAVDHIEAFCKYYQKSPEELGLINWRDQPSPAPKADAAAPTHDAEPRDHDGDPARLVDAWLRESAVSIATAVLTALARCPRNLTGLADPEQPTRSQDDPSDDPPVEASAPTSPPT